MANSDHVLADLHLFHEEPDITLPVGDVQSFGEQAQPVQESRQGFGQPEPGIPVLDPSMADCSSRLSACS